MARYDLILGAGDTGGRGKAEEKQVLQPWERHQTVGDGHAGAACRGQSLLATLLFPQHRSLPLGRACGHPCTWTGKPAQPRAPPSPVPPALLCFPSRACASSRRGGRVHARGDITSSKRPVFPSPSCNWATSNYNWSNQYYNNPSYHNY